MMYHEAGESSTSDWRSGVIERPTNEDKNMDVDEDGSSGKHKHEHRHKEHKHHHQREKSKLNVDSPKVRDEEQQGKRDGTLRHEKSKSRENLKHKEEEDRAREVDKESKSSRGHLRDGIERRHSHRDGLERRDSKRDGIERTDSKRSGMERKDSKRDGLERSDSKREEMEKAKDTKRRDSSRHIRRASELTLEPVPITEANALLKQFARNMDLMHHHKSEPDLRGFIAEAKLKKQAEQSYVSEQKPKPKPKKAHPAVALIKSAISSRLSAKAKDMGEKERVRETAHRMRRHTISEAASFCNYEPREFSAASNSTTSSSTSNYTSEPVAEPFTNPDPEPAENVDYESGSDHELSPDMIFENSSLPPSYTPDLMRYADVDLAPQLGFIDVS